MTVGSMLELLGPGICIPVPKGKGQRNACYLGGQMTGIKYGLHSPYATHGTTAYSLTPFHTHDKPSKNAMQI